LARKAAVATGEQGSMILLIKAAMPSKGFTYRFGSRTRALAALGSWLPNSQAAATSAE